MASKALKTIAFLLTLSIIFFSTSEAACQTLKLGACAGLLNNLLGGVVVGTPPTSPCCSILSGLADFEAATCLCKAIKANVLGVNLDVSPGLSLVLNNCGKNASSGFEC